MNEHVSTLLNGRCRGRLTGAVHGEVPRSFRIFGLLTDVERVADDEQSSREQVQLVETRADFLIASNSCKIKRQGHRVIIE
jgi:hypothetical protein